jgi:hypothetical protein
MSKRTNWLGSEHLIPVGSWVVILVGVGVGPLVWVFRKRSVALAEMRECGGCMAQVKARWKP